MIIEYLFNYFLEFLGIAALTAVFFEIFKTLFSHLK